MRYLNIYKIRNYYSLFLFENNIKKKFVHWIYDNVIHVLIYIKVRQIEGFNPTWPVNQVAISKLN